jgi:hypothetical protein
MSRSRLVVWVPLDLKANFSEVAKKAGVSRQDFLAKIISRAVANELNQRVLCPVKSTETLIPQQTVRLMLKDRAQDPPISYRELAEKYGYALRTVHRACTAQGGYRTKVKRCSLGRKSKVSPEQRAEILLDSSSLTVLQLSKKYDVPRATVYRVINGEGCYAS